MHFIEKVLSKMLDALALYPTQRPFISSLCIFFHSQPCRVLFLVEGQVGTPLHGLFKTGPPIIDDTGRDWATFSRGLEWLDERMRTIVTHWPWQPDFEDGEAQFKFNGETIEYDPKQYSLHKARISAAIRKPLNLNYLSFITWVARWVASVEVFFAGCKCHPPEVL